MKGLIPPVSAFSLPLPMGVVISLVSSVTDGEFEFSVSDGKFKFTGEAVEKFLGEFMTILDPFSAADWWRWAGYPDNNEFNGFLWETAIENLMEEGVPLGDWAIWSEITDKNKDNPEWGTHLIPAEGSKKLA